MQLESPHRSSGVRGRLAAAAGTLLALSVPALAGADAPTNWQLDASTLFYGERGRTGVFEPIVRVTRLFQNGQTLSARFGLDTMTGSSPTGAMPSGRVQTVTTPSGHLRTVSGSEIPLSRFRDARGSLDLDWQVPLTPALRTVTGAHVSRERDYQSLGADATVSIDLMHRLTTFTAGAGYNHDLVIPVGGTRVPFTDGTEILTTTADPRNVTSGLVGVSHILSRRWMMEVNLSRSIEKGYLTEPYKVVSLVDQNTGFTTGDLTENRPGSRRRADLLVGSVYHFTPNILYTSYRYYWDDWGVRSHTVDLRYRMELEDGRYFQPHVRYYTQTAANFFTFGLPAGSALPQFATSDYRLGPLHTVTLGGKYGFPVPNGPGEISIRGEYMRQFGSGPAGAPGVEKQFDLFPPVDVTTLLLGYTVNFR